MNKNIRVTLSKIKSNIEELRNKLLQLNYKDNLEEIKSINKQISSFIQIVEKYDIFLKKENEYKKNLEFIKNEQEKEMLELIKAENTELFNDMEKINKELLIQLIPKDESDSSNAIIEIRGAAGGDEANIFVGDLFKMYLKYAESNNWSIEIFNSIESGSGGFSQLEFFVKGRKSYLRLKNEAGIHRVQRVPKTESKGRVHTSTVSVAVLPELKKVDIKIKPNDLRIDTYRASGAGGQHVNKTDSAVRITHIPTGIVSVSQDGRSQHSNKEKAMHVLMVKLHAKQLEKEQEEINLKRNKAIGQGKRSEKIRTYNYPQNRITDHRINLSLNKLNWIMEGDLDEIVNEILIFYQNEAIKNIG